MRRRRAALPLDEARLLPGMRQGFLEQEQAAILAEAIIETGNGAPVIADPRRAAGDPVANRGVPLVGGRGSIGGALKGSRSEDVIAELDRMARNLTHP